MLWILAVLLGILLTKYYTETVLRRLRSKALEGQRSLAGVKQALGTAQDELIKAEGEEKSFKERLDRLRAVVVDLEVEIQESTVKARKATSTQEGADREELEIAGDGSESEPAARASTDPG